jgi:hypothetical protein
MPVIYIEIYSISFKMPIRDNVAVLYMAQAAALAINQRAGAQTSSPRKSNFSGPIFRKGPGA